MSSTQFPPFGCDSAQWPIIKPDIYFETKPFDMERSESHDSGFASMYSPVPSTPQDIYDTEYEYEYGNNQLGIQTAQQSYFGNSYQAGQSGVPRSSELEPLSPQS